MHYRYPHAQIGREGRFSLGPAPFLDSYGSVPRPLVLRFGVGLFIFWLWWTWCRVRMAPGIPGISLRKKADPE
jgi:hypothetical protein